MTDIIFLNPEILLTSATSGVCQRRVVPLLHGRIAGAVKFHLFS